MAKPTFAEQCKTKVDAWAKRIYWLPLLVSFLLFAYQSFPRDQMISLSIDLLPHGFAINRKEIAFGMSQAEVLALMGEPRKYDGDTWRYFGGVSISFTTYGDPHDETRYVKSLRVSSHKDYVTSIAFGRKRIKNSHTTIRQEVSFDASLARIVERMAQVEDPPVRVNTVFEHESSFMISADIGNALFLFFFYSDLPSRVMSYSQFSEPKHLRAPLRKPVAIELLPHGVRVGESEFPFGMSEAQLIEQWGEADRIRRSENGATYVYSGQFILDFSREKDSDTPLGLDRIVLNTHDTPEAYMVLGESRLAFDRPYLMLVDHLKALRADGRIDANDSMSIFTWQEGPLRVVQREGKVTLLIYTHHANDSARLPALASS